MKLETLHLKAGIPQWIGRGRYVRVLSASHPIALETMGLDGGENVHSRMPANIGAEFQAFEKAMITSDVDQVVEIAYSERIIFDNRLGVDGALILETVDRACSDFNVSSVTVGPSGLEVLSGAVTNRRSAIISPAGPIRIAKTQGGTSFTVAGVLNHEASGSLWASADSDTEVEILEYLN